MATYLPNITDYIPHIQPFKPDYNFYQKALETKEAQYKAGHDKISNLYGTLLNSEMLREPNKEKRDKFFTQVQNDIQRMSSVDLSLEQNVNTAYSVFQPIIDDKNISRDMAWTKNYRNEKQKGEYFRNCLDKECLGKYWKEGDEYLDYMASDFSKSDDDQAMRFQSPKYVPFVNVDERANEVIKAIAPNVERVSFSGGYIYKTTNGEPITDQLQHYLTGILGNDSQITDIYNVKSTIARKRYIDANSSRLGGEDAAELEYLTKMIDTSKASSAKNYSNASKILDNLNISSAAYTEFLKRNGYSTASDKEKVVKIEKAKQEASLMQGVLDHYKKTEESISNTTDLDRESLRRRVDGAVSSIMFSNDMLGSAHAYAALHNKVDITTDPYALKAYEAKLNFKYASNLEEVKSKFKKQEGEYQDPLNYAITPVTGYTHNVDKNVPVSVGTKETMDQITGGYAEQINTFLKRTQEQWKENAEDTTDPTKATLAKQALFRVFGPNIDANRNLIEGFGKTPNFHNEDSAFYYQKMYAAALAENELHGDLYFHGNPDVKAGLTAMAAEIKGTSEIFSMYDDDVKFNNKTVVNNIISAYKDNEHSKLAGFLLKPNGHTRNEGEFLQAVYANAPVGYRDTPKFYKEAGNAWDDLSELFVKNMDSNTNPAIRNINSSGFITSGGGALTANALGWHGSATDPHSPGTLNILDVLKNDLPKAISVLPSSNHTANDIKSTDANATNLLNRLREDFFSRNWKINGNKPPTALMDIQPVAADSRGVVGYRITPGKDYLESISRPTKNGMEGDAAFLWDNTKHRWKDDVSMTMYVQASDVTSSPAKAILAPISVETAQMKRNGYININGYPDGGNIKIKKTSDGYIVSGNYFNAVDGKLVSIPIPPKYQNFQDLKSAVMTMKSNLYTAQKTNQELITNYRYSQGTISYEELQKQLSQQ